jgi:hypothetical protein
VMMSSFRITLALVRRSDDGAVETRMRAIAHNAGTETEACRVFDQVLEMIRTASYREKLRRSPKLQKSLFGA